MCGWLSTNALNLLFCVACQVSRRFWLLSTSLITAGRVLSGVYTHPSGVAFSNSPARVCTLPELRNDAKNHNLSVSNRSADRGADIPQLAQIAEAVLGESLRLELGREVAGREVIAGVVEIHSAGQAIAAFLRDDVGHGSAVGQLGRASTQRDRDLPDVRLRNAEKRGRAAFAAHAANAGAVNQEQANRAPARRGSPCSSLRGRPAYRRCLDR